MFPVPKAPRVIFAVVDGANAVIARRAGSSVMKLGKLVVDD